MMWLLVAVLLLVVVPVVVVLLNAVLSETKAIVPAIDRITVAAQKGSKDLDAAPLLLTTQDQVIKTIESAANYGGSLDTIVDDA